MLVLPSLEEGFGIPALEAMTIGVPVIASNRGALPEVVGDAGILVDPENVREFSNALERVLCDDGTATIDVGEGSNEPTSSAGDQCRALYDAYRARCPPAAEREVTRRFESASTRANCSAK